MSQQTTQTTRNTTGSNSSVATSAGTAKNALLAFLDKPVLETMDDFYSFRDYQKRFKVGQRNPCVVSHDVYDIVTEGDMQSPLFWSMDVPVIDVTRKQEAEDMLHSVKKTETVIIR